MKNALDPVFNALFSTLIWLVPLMLAIAIAQSPWAKGHFGEWMVRLLLHWGLDKTTYTTVHNVTLATPDGSTQIDHVVVSRHGVFAIETKNMQGWIFGGERQAEWTQKLFKRTFRFQNPLRQNYRHTQALAALLEVPHDTIHSVVVFVGGSTFKTPMPPNVTFGNGCVRYIQSLQQAVFTRQQAADLALRLQSGRLAPTRATHAAHVQQLRQRHAAKGAAPAAASTPQRPKPASPEHAVVSVAQPQPPCPTCGSAMVLRTSQRGSLPGQRFWGCSTFPKCRGLRKLHDSPGSAGQ